MFEWISYAVSRTKRRRWDWFARSNLPVLVVKIRYRNTWFKKSNEHHHDTKQWNQRHLWTLGSSPKGMWLWSTFLTGLASVFYFCLPSLHFRTNKKSIREKRAIRSLLVKTAHALLIHWHWKSPNASQKCCCIRLSQTQYNFTNTVFA